MRRLTLFSFVLFLTLAIQPIIHNVLADNDLDGTAWDATLHRFDSETGNYLGRLSGLITFETGQVQFNSEDFNICCTSYYSEVLRFGVIIWNALGYGCLTVNGGYNLSGRVGNYGSLMMGEIGGMVPTGDVGTSIALYVYRFHARRVAYIVEE